MKAFLLFLTLTPAFSQAKSPAAARYEISVTEAENLSKTKEYIYTGEPMDVPLAGKLWKCNIISGPTPLDPHGGVLTCTHESGAISIVPIMCVPQYVEGGSLTLGTKGSTDGPTINWMCAPGKHAVTGKKAQKK